MVYTNAVTLKSGLGTTFAQVVSLGLVYLVTSVLGQFVSSGFNPIWYAYFGNLIAVSFSVLAACYAITKIVYATISLGVSDHLTSYGFSGLGNKLTLLEFIHMSMFVMYATSLAGFGYAESNMVWRNFEVARLNGEDMTMRKGYTYLAMQGVIGVGALIGGFLLGDISCGLLGFFDNYDTSQEGTANNATEADSKGTSIIEDYIWTHFAIIQVGTMVAGIIAYGAFDFALMGLGNKMSDLLP